MSKLGLLGLLGRKVLIYKAFRKTNWVASGLQLGLHWVYSGSTTGLNWDKNLGELGLQARKN
jgi:hypothetical protein